MEFQNRDEIKNKMNANLEPFLNKYKLEDIGLYEEEGPKDTYFLGYTVRKDNHVFMMNQEYKKNNKGELARKKQEWTIQTENGESKGFASIEEVFSEIQ